MEYSDKSRRTMSQALQSDELSPEARAFLTPDRPLAGTQPPAPRRPRAVRITAARPPLPIAGADPNSDRAAPTSFPADPPPTAGVVSMTFRLAPEIPAALLRAAVERKVRKQKPFTQQEIVSDAIKQWLKANGFSA
jgi:hypothetical protein